MIELPAINSIIMAVFASAMAFCMAWYWRSREKLAAAVDRAADATRERDKRIAELERQLSLVNAAVVPISTAFQAILIKELTHYHTPELDQLMTKIGPPSTLTSDEETRMSVLLDERTRDMDGLIDEAERDAARMLPLVMKRARHEATPAVTLVVVSALPVLNPEETR